MTITNSFSVNTKIKSAQVNQNFIDVYRFIKASTSSSITFISTNAQIPANDTIPQIGEGVEVISKAHALEEATNILHITGSITCGSVAIDKVCLALFNGASNAIDCKWGTLVDADTPLFLAIDSWIIPATTDSKTYTMRTGVDAGARRIDVNGWAGARKGGGQLKTQIIIEEFKV